MDISPFGGDSKLLLKLHVSELKRRYIDKCGIDISFAFGDVNYAELHQCKTTGYKYWLPPELAGKDDFYRALSAAWPNYYRNTRWEYASSMNLVEKNDVCLEVGCGRGYFLKSIESRCKKSVGIEFNKEAIDQKVCNSDILDLDISELGNTGDKYNKIFSFQVLEHIPEPMPFLLNCLRLLKPGGLLVISVPNDEWVVHSNMEDPFNLPPHHIGCYSYSVFQQLSEILGAEITDVRIQPANFPGIEVTERTGSKLLWRIFSRVTRAIGSPVLRYLREPGHTMVVIFAKKS